MTELALIVGVGPGLGWSLARRFAREGMHVAMAARDPGRLEGLEKQAPDFALSSHALDAADAGAVRTLFDELQSAHGTPRAVIYNAGTFEPGRVADIDPADFERCWRIGCLGGFLVGREAAARMPGNGGGTLIFTGATASRRGGAGFANLAVPKFGLRALSQCLARELGPENVHVAHVIVDGRIRSERPETHAAGRAEDSLLEPGAIADEYWRLHRQHRSAWTQELDLRPWVEKF